MCKKSHDYSKLKEFFYLKYYANLYFTWKTKYFAIYMSTKKIYFKNLDGLRFLCFLTVFFYHSFQTESANVKSSSVYQFIKFGLAENGFLGVNFFFVLSGFLITYLLIKEKELNKNINIPNFWVRRILRIWPLYFLFSGSKFTSFGNSDKSSPSWTKRNKSIWYFE